MGTHSYIISRGYAVDCPGVVYISIYNIYKRILLFNKIFLKLSMEILIDNNGKLKSEVIIYGFLILFYL